jgi:hypothetical protein
LRIQKTRIERNRFAALGAHRGIRDESGRFDDEAEVVGHLLRIAQIVGDGERRIKRAVDADRTQQRMRAVSGEAVARQFAVAVIVAVDDAFPARERPRRGAQMDLRRQAAGDLQDFG